MSDTGTIENGFRKAASLTALVALGIFAIPGLAAACSGTGEVKSNTTTYEVGKGIKEYTVFFNGDGACAGKKIRIETRYSIGGQTYPAYAADCPLYNVEGNYCALTTGSGNAWQFVVGNLPTFVFKIPGTGYVDARILADGQLILTTPPLEYKIVGKGESTQPAAVAPKPPPEPVETKLSVAIGSLTETTDIALYIATVFNWAIPIVAILATAMIAWGGLKWLTAGGDSGRVTSAKETMTNATVGLVIAFGSYAILSTVNPDIVKFKPIVPTPVERILAAPETYCEDLVSTHPEYQVNPPKGNCGDKGVVTLKPGVAGTPLNDSCKFRTCAAGLGCATVSGVTQCVNCNDYDEDKLKTLGHLNGSDSVCAQFGPKISGIGGFFACVYSNDTGLATLSNPLGSRGCAVMRVDCDKGNIKKCEDYGTWAALYPQGAPSNGFAVRYERSCIADLSVASLCGYSGPSGHLSLVCNAADPCGVGPCHVEDNKEISDFEAITGTAWFKDADLQYCKPD